MAWGDALAAGGLRARRGCPAPARLGQCVLLTAAGLVVLAALLWLVDPHHAHGALTGQGLLCRCGGGETAGGAGAGAALQSLQAEAAGLRATVAGVHLWRRQVTEVAAALRTDVAARRSGSHTAAAAAASTEGTAVLAALLTALEGIGGEGQQLAGSEPPIPNLDAVANAVRDAASALDRHPRSPGPSPGPGVRAPVVQPLQPLHPVRAQAARPKAHLVIVSGDEAGSPITERETIPLLKSLLLHAASCDLNFTFLTGGGSAEVLARFFSAVHSPQVGVSYSLLDLNVADVERRLAGLNVNYKHHSGAWGVAKFFLADMLPGLEMALVLDTDFLFFQDVCTLWQWGLREVAAPGRMHASTIPRRGKYAWDTDGSYGLCSCLSFFNLGAMRAHGWTGRAARKAFAQHLPKDPASGRPIVKGDQTMNVALANLLPSLFVEIPRSWALNKCQHFFRVRPLPDATNSRLFLGALHFNCIYDRKSQGPGQGPGRAGANSTGGARLEPAALAGYVVRAWQPFIDAAVRFRPEWLNAGRSTNTTRLIARRPL